MTQLMTGCSGPRGPPPRSPRQNFFNPNFRKSPHPVFLFFCKGHMNPLHLGQKSFLRTRKTGWMLDWENLPEIFTSQRFENHKKDLEDLVFT